MATPDDIRRLALIESMLKLARSGVAPKRLLTGRLLIGRLPK
ncbi:MAG TPA: hypothetical protein VF459_08785 [Caulobacteraceae bacterium]